MRLVNASSTQWSQIRSFNRSARLFLAATVINGIVFSGWFLFFNFYILERGFSRDFLGLVNSMPSIAALLFGIPMGLLSDRIGRKPAMLLGATLTIVCMGLQVTVTNPHLILAAAFCAGIGNSLYFLSQAPFLMKVSNGENRTLLFSLNFGLVTLSGAIGSIFAGQLPSFFGDLLNVPARSAGAYQAVLLASVCLSLLAIIPLLLIHEPKGKTGAGSGDKGKVGLWKVLSRPITLKLAFPNLLIGFGAAILVPYMNLFFSERFAVTDQTLGIFFSISALLTGVGSIIGPRLAGGLGSKVRAIVYTQAASLAFLILMGFSPLLGLAVLGFLARGTLMNMAVPLFDAFSMEQIQEREQGTVNSVRNLSWQVGWAVGPYISGVIQEAYGFTPIFATTAVLYGLAIVLTWIFFRDSENQHQEVHADQEIDASSLFEATGD
jgi:MFS family permease